MFFSTFFACLFGMASAQDPDLESTVFVMATSGVSEDTRDARQMELKNGFKTSIDEVLPLVVDLACYKKRPGRQSWTVISDGEEWFLIESPYILDWPWFNWRKREDSRVQTGTFLMSPLLLTGLPPPVTDVPESISLIVLCE